MFWGRYSVISDGHSLLSHFAAHFLILTRREGSHCWLLPELLVGVHEADAGLRAEHRVVALLPVDQLQLVELHVLSSLLDRCLLLDHFLLKALDRFQVFGPRWPLIVQLRDLHESLVELTVLLVHEHGGILELSLKLSDFLGLLLDKLLHRLAKVVLQLDLLFFELVFDLPCALLVLRDALVHDLLSLSHGLLHRVDLRVLRCHGALKTLNLSFQLFDGRPESINLVLESLLGLLVLLDLSIV